MSSADVHPWVKGSQRGNALSLRTSQCSSNVFTQQLKQTCTQHVKEH